VTLGFRRGVNGKLEFPLLYTLGKMLEARRCELRLVFRGVMLIFVICILQEISFGRIWFHLRAVDS